MHRHFYLLIWLLILFAGCRHEEVVYPALYEYVGEDTLSGGLYVLNEGNMGSNKAQIDYMDFSTGYYTRNIYGDRNPNVVKELGDVGNDLAVYGQRMYAVINCSHKVEVMDRQCRRIGQINIPNCRYIRFSDGKAYVSAYVGALMDGEQIGAIYEVDTATLEVTRQCPVGFQPDELTIWGGAIYVCNSGGYRGAMGKGYDTTVSVVNRVEMTEVARYRVGQNPHQIEVDEEGRLWVGCRGDYMREKPSLWLLSSDGRVVKVWENIAIDNMTSSGKYIYALGSQQLHVWNTETLEETTIPAINESLKEYEHPYGLLVSPWRIYITDAKNYVSSGFLYCYDHQGRLIYKAKGGDIPAHMCLVE